MKVFTLFLIPIIIFIHLSALSKSLEANETATVNTNVLLFYENNEKGEQFLKIVHAVKDYFSLNKSSNVDIKTVHEVKINGTDLNGTILNICSQIDDGIPSDIAIDFTRSGSSSEAVKIVTKLTNIPTISVSFGHLEAIKAWNFTKENASQYLIRISPPADILIQSIRLIVEKQNMTTAAVLFDDQQFEMEHKEDNLLVQQEHTRHVFIQLEKGNTDIEKQIIHLLNQDIQNIFIVASPNKISTFLSVASRLQLKLRKDQQLSYYSMSLEDEEPKCLKCESNINLIHMSPNLTNVSSRKKLLMEFYEMNWKSLTDLFYFDVILNAVMAVKKMKIEGVWNEMAVKKKCSTSKAEFIDSLQLDLFSALSSLQHNDDLGKFHLQRNGTNHPKFEMNIKKFSYKKPSTEDKADVITSPPMMIGTWKSGLGENQSDLIILSGKDSANIEKAWKYHRPLIILRVITVVNPPFVYQKEGCNSSEIIQPGDNASNSCFYGYCIDMLNEIQDKFNFSYIIQNVSDYGHMDEKEPHDFHPNSLIGLLKQREADLAVADLSLTSERETAVDFTLPFYELVGFSFIMKKIDKKDTSYFKLLRVIHSDVWITFIGSTICTSLMIWIYDVWSPHSYRNNKEVKLNHDERTRVFTYRESLWFVLTSFVPQGGGIGPRNFSGVMTVAVWWIIAYVAIAAYTAVLTSQFTLERLENNKINSLEHLSTQHAVSFAPQKNSEASRYFQRMEDLEELWNTEWMNMNLNESWSNYEASKFAVNVNPINDKFTKMNNMMKENGMPETFADGIKRVINSTPDDAFAFIAETPALRYEALTNCGLRLGREEFSRRPIAFAVQKGSAFKDELSEAIQYLLTEGKLVELKEKWWDGNNLTRTDCPKMDNGIEALNVNNIAWLFIMMVVATIVCAINTCIGKILDRRQNTLVVDQQ